MLNPGRKKKKKKMYRPADCASPGGGATFGTCTRAEWQGSVVTAFLGEVDLSFSLFFGNPPPLKKKKKRKGTTGCQRLTPMAKERLSQNKGGGGLGFLLLQLLRTQDVDVT